MSSSKPEHGQIFTSVPFLMAGGLVLGTLTAVGHHIFATQVSGNPVESNEQQGWYISIVTGLAFLTKAFLSASAGLAYTQLLWFVLRSKTFTLAGVDATFSLVNNPWSFFRWELWFNGLSLVFMATIVWAIPIIAVFAPGTLTVQISTEPNITLVQRSVSSLNYSAVRQFGQIGSAGGGTNLGFQGPSSSLSRLVATVAAQGAVLNPPAPYANCSYHLQFYGPSLSCGAATSTNATRIVNLINPPGGSPDPRLFVSFVPMDCHVSRSNETDNAMCGLNFALDGTDGRSADTTYDSASEDHARMYVVVPEIPLAETSFGSRANKTIECGLFNTSYEVEFSSANGQLKSAIKKATRLNGVSGDYARMSNITCDGYEEGICYPDSVAYVAVLNALNQQLTGYLKQSHYGRIFAQQTQVDKTTLMDTKELYQPQYFMNHGTSPQGANKVPADAMEIAQALEEVFTNATLSLFSSTSFLQNETAAAPVPVTVFTPQNKFVYRSRNLLISYISGVVVTTLCVLVGFLCISKASSTAFSASFSTIMRTTRNPDLDALVSPAESSGAEPLGKGLAAVKLKLVRQETGSTISRVPTGMGIDFDEHDGGNGWTCFTVQKDVLSTKMGDKTNPPTSDVDLDSLLTQSEV